LTSPVKGVYHEALAEGFLGKYGPVDDASIAAADKHATELKRRYARARTEEERTRVLNLASEATLRANMMRAERDFLQRQGLEVRGASQAAASERAVRISLAGSPGKNAAAVRIQRIERGRRARARVESMRTERDANRDDARASFDDEAAERYSRARARVGKLRAEERVGAAKARVARHKAEERTRRWAEPEPAYDSPYLHSRETTPVKSRPMSASSSKAASGSKGFPTPSPSKRRPTSASTSASKSPKERLAAAEAVKSAERSRKEAEKRERLDARVPITFPGEDDHVRRMRLFRERVEAKVNAAASLPAPARPHSAPAPAPSPGRSILKSPARNNTAVSVSASYESTHADRSVVSVRSSASSMGGLPGVASRPRSAQRSLHVSFELADDTAEESPGTMARKAEQTMDERFQPRDVADAVRVARAAERALAQAEAAVETAMRKKQMRDKVKARTSKGGTSRSREGTPRSTPRKIQIVDEDAGPEPSPSPSRPRSALKKSPGGGGVGTDMSPARSPAAKRRVRWSPARVIDPASPAANRSPSLEQSPSPGPASASAVVARAASRGAVPVRATARAFSRNSKNEKARAYNDALRDREHRKRLERRERLVESERSAAAAAGVSVADHLDAKLTARQRAAAIMKQVDAAQRNSETVAGIFVSYIAARKSGTEVDRRHAKDVAAMAGSMPAFRNLPPRHVVGALDTAEVTRHAAGAVIHHEGDRGDALCVVVGGEVGLFQKSSNLKGPKALAPDPRLWATSGAERGRDGADPTFALVRPGDKRPGSAVTPPRDVNTRGAYDGDDGLMTDAARDVQAAALGAPKNCGALARRVRLGHVFGEKAVLRRGGEARAATAVALSPVTIVSINKWRYDAVMEAAERTESREVAEFLRETELFPESRVSDADLTELASRLAVIRANPGDTIVAAGDHAKGVFFVRVGRAKVSAVAKVMVESPDIVVGPDDLRASVQSLRSSHDSGSTTVGASPLRPRSGSGGGNWRRAPTYELRDVPLGDLVTPAVFGEECLVPFVHPDGGAGPGRHAFTVVVDPEGDPAGAVFLRLPPSALKTLPGVVSKRLTQLAKSTGAASKEATRALGDADLADLRGFDSSVARSVPREGLPKSATSPSVRASFGTSVAPRHEPIRGRFESANGVEEGRAPVGVGLGGGGGRTREVGTPTARARQARRDSGVRPATALAAMTRTEMRTRGYLASPVKPRPASARSPIKSTLRASPMKSRPRSNASNVPSVDPDSTFEAYLDHDDDADASFGSPWGTPVKKSGDGETAATRKSREQLRSSILGSLGGGATGGGRKQAWKQGPDIQVRLTKKAAALAEKNRPIREWRERGLDGVGVGGTIGADGGYLGRPGTAAGGRPSTARVDRGAIRPRSAAAAMEDGGIWGEHQYDMGGWTRGSKL
jgi:CRP-like cAMP-binding protein